MSQPGAMSEMDRFVFECFGYLIIPDVLTEEQCDAALEAARRVHVRPAWSARRRVAAR